MKNSDNKYFAIILVIFLILPLRMSHADPLDKVVGVLVSRQIIPYMTMVKGFVENIDTYHYRLFFINESGKIETEYGNQIDLKTTDLAIMVAVGPEALSYLTVNEFNLPIVYGMILHPNIKSDKSHFISGISLNIFSIGQIDLVSRIFPDIKRIGVLYNPENESRWLTSAIFRGPSNGVSIVPLSVSNRSKIIEIFEENISKIDALLFVPDSTVISKTIIRYIIKKGIYKGVPAIGYNSFFHDSGAALSFIIDYKDVGKQVADLTKARLKGENVISDGPRCKIILNKNVVKLLNLQVNKNLPDSVEFK